ncbi:MULTISPECIES: hypothetical protein [unclassified Pseudomonas]|uniref:hypothetical protein n=1 Tax=unclassified Pseudomonas TaxID=196821 RepID=UPI00128BABFF|nr:MULTISPECIES: hypothetical protein [unclassified Pseudomonas]MPQ68299.1 hypothetical protein [Pseudomonas sp. MWU12-2323]
MIDLFWFLIARLLAPPVIADKLISRAKLTPYQHMMSADGTGTYMGRWWLFNPYDRKTHKPKIWSLPWSFRIHHIMQPDTGRALHDHPWNARTIILRGWYIEERLSPGNHTQLSEHVRRSGNTSHLNHGEFHRIEEVSPGGVFTLFITSRRKGGWGFLVNSVKVSLHKYLGEKS